MKNPSKGQAPPIPTSSAAASPQPTTTRSSSGANAVANNAPNSSSGRWGPTPPIAMAATDNAGGGRRFLHSPQQVQAQQLQSSNNNNKNGGVGGGGTVMAANNNNSTGSGGPNCVITKNAVEEGRGTQQQQQFLSSQAMATLGSGNLRDIVRLPSGEDQNEWIAANISDFFRQVSMLYGMIVENCTDESCPRMTAGQQHEYFWSDSKGTLMQPCPANVYIDYLLSWVQEELDDEHTFPSQIGKPFPPNFLLIAQTIMKRLFRVYAHIYHQHFELIEQLKAVEHLNTSFKHFVLFVGEFGLIDRRQMAPLQELIEKLLPSAGPASALANNANA